MYNASYNDIIFIQCVLFYKIVSKSLTIEYKMFPVDFVYLYQYLSKSYLLIQLIHIV